MSKGIFTAVSGAMAQNQRMETIANNLANVNTPAFKRDAQIFKEYLSAYEKEPSTIEVPRIPASIESFYDMQGGDKSYVDTAGTYTDFSQGFLKSTGNTLDVGLEGEGFFEVASPDGPKLARSGSFSIDGDGRLVTKQGFPVLKEGAPGSDPAARTIRLSSPNVTITQNGDIFENGEVVGKLSVVSANNKDALQKVGNNLYTFRNGMDPELVIANEVKVNQGFLEGSNVNAVREMTDMIAATRTFESTQKAIQAYDQMQQRLVNEVPKVNNQG